MDFIHKGEQMRYSTKKLGLLSTALVTIAMTAGVGVTTSGAGAAGTPASNSKNWIIQEEQLNGQQPTFAYPLMPIADFTQSNGGFQQGLYRPLYWFGTSTGKVDINPAASLAAAPVLSNGGKTATITLKSGYKWSNGEKLDAANIMEFLNLFTAYPTSYGAYGPPVNGTSVTIPDIISSASEPNGPTGLTVKINFYSPVSAHWFLFNPMSEVTPFPLAWNIQAKGWTPGSTLTASDAASKAHGNLAVTASSCPTNTFIGNGNTTGPTGSNLTDPNGQPTILPQSAKTVAEACQEVVATMDSFANDTTNYANASTETGKLWGISDSPWKLKTFNEATAAMSFVRNSSYGGPAAYAKGINVVPCQSVTGDCYNLLLAGKLTVGGLPSADAAPITNLSQAPGQQTVALAKNYNLVVSPSWSIGFSPLNFKSANTGATDDSAVSGDTTPRSALYAQGYVARALNDSYPVTLIDTQVYRGYSYSTYGPIPPLPTNTFSTIKASPYKLSLVKTELSANGWTLQSYSGSSAGLSKVWTCTNPGTGTGKCGAGIGSGATMTFRVDAITQGSTQAQQEESIWQSAAASAGINLIINGGNFDQTIAQDTPSSTKWDMYTGSGWIYAPDFNPSGEGLWLTGAGGDSGSYSSATNDKNVLGTLNGTVSLDTYAKYLEANPPVVWNHWSVGLDEISNKVGGFVPQATGYSTPELWYLKK
jgi:peptide/nickel transport system substrate-binding protein